MNISHAGLDFIKQFEGLRLTAYPDQVGVWTIGYGSTMYDNGEKVKKGDVINEARALELLEWGVDTKANLVVPMVKVPLNQNQIDSILSLTYNIGVAGFGGSTVLRRINKNPSDPIIRDAFMLWDKGTIDGKLVDLPGLKKRREHEADLYFKI